MTTQPASVSIWASRAGLALSVLFAIAAIAFSARLQPVYNAALSCAGLSAIFLVAALASAHLWRTAGAVALGSALIALGLVHNNPTSDTDPASITTIAGALLFVAGISSAIWSFFRSSNSSVVRLRSSWNAFRQRSTATQGIIAGSITIAVIVMPIFVSTFIAEVTRGRLTGGGPSWYPNAVVTTARYLHPGDATTYNVWTERAGPARGVTCTLLATDVQSVLIESDTYPIDSNGHVNVMWCTWAISPTHPGTHIIGFQIGPSENKNVRSRGFSTIYVSDPPFSLPNISTVVGLASGAVTLYLLAAGKRRDKERD